MTYLNIYNKYYFSNFMLHSTRDVLYHFLKQNIETQSIETLSVIISKSGFSNFMLLSTRDVSYHFFKQNIITLSIETLGVIISKSGYKNQDCSVEIFSDRRLGNARLKQMFIFYCVVCAHSPVQRSAPLMRLCAPGMD